MPRRCELTGKSQTGHKVTFEVRNGGFAWRSAHAHQCSERAQEPDYRGGFDVFLRQQARCG